MTRSIVSWILGLVLCATPVLAGGPDSTESERCPNLRSPAWVSYERQELRLFRRIIGLVKESSQKAPATRTVVETFAACLASVTARGDAPWDHLQVVVAADGEHLQVRHGEEQSLMVAVGSDVPDLARQLTKSIVTLAASGERDELKNLIWFLWIESYLKAVGEKYNSYDYASELLEERAEDRGRSFAVGFDVEVLEGRLYVSEIHDIRLREAGLSTGDELIAFDDRKIQDLSLPELQKYWFNSRPHSFILETQRSGQPHVFAGTSVPRRHSTVSWTVRGRMGYVRIYRFAERSLVEMRRALRRIEAEQATSLILDVRDNPGGMLSIGLVDMFFRPGQTIASYLDHGEEPPRDIDATVEYHGIPAALLVDRKSASMAELLTAAFTAHGRGPVVGETTLGKSVSQALHPVLEEGRLRLVHSTYYYPGSRESWTDVGIAPALPVAIDDEARDRLQPYLDSQILRLDEQWEVDSVLRAAARHLEEQP